MITKIWEWAKQNIAELVKWKCTKNNSATKGIVNTQRGIGKMGG
jgi:hypothetical protein